MTDYTGWDRLVTAMKARPGPVLVVDAMNFAHRCRTGLGTSLEGYAFNWVRNLRAEVQQHSPGLVILAWEGNPRHRRAVLPTYKASRKEGREEGERESFYALTHTVRNLFLDKLPLWHLRHPLFEADDLMGALARLGTPAKPVILSTTDRDMLQAYEVAAPGSVLVWDPRGKSVREPMAESCTLVKSLMGDPGDDIPALLPAARARELALDPAGMVRWIEEGGPERVGEWERNMVLVQFARPDLVLDRARLEVSQGEWRPAELRFELEQIRARSLLEEKGWGRQVETWAELG